MSSHKKYSRMNKLPGLRSACKIMNCGITASPCENTLLSPCARLMQRRVTDCFCCALHPFFHQQKFPRGRGSCFLFFLTHQRQYVLYISCVRRSVVWRESDSQWNTVAYSITLVAMETAELTKSVKWLQELSMTKLIIRENAPVQIRAPCTWNTFQEYSTYPFIQTCLTLKNVWHFLTHLKQLCCFSVQSHSNLCLLFRPAQVQTCLLACVTIKDSEKEGVKITTDKIWRGK